MKEALAVGVEALVQQFEGLADWDAGGEDEKDGPKVIQFPQGGPKGR